MQVFNHRVLVTRIHHRAIFTGRLPQQPDVIIGKSGKDVVAAVVAGYEVQIRLSLALVPKDHYDRGYHPTATCGAFGAAAAAARVLGLSAEQTAHALGASLSQIEKHLIPWGMLLYSSVTASTAAKR